MIIPSIKTINLINSKEQVEMFILMIYLKNSQSEIDNIKVYNLGVIYLV